MSRIIIGIIGLIMFSLNVYLYIWDPLEKHYDLNKIVFGWLIVLFILNYLFRHSKCWKAPMDDVMSAELEKELRQKGIDVYCDATVTEILEEEGGLSCVITPNGEGEPIKMRAGQILMAIGRRPNVEKLLGKDISLEMEGGKIAVNSDFETSERGIYAIGDVSSPGCL